jgi:hypothetical protein
MKTIKVAGNVIYVLFFPLFWSVKKCTKYVFNRRKKKAIRRANERSSSEKRKVFVMQIEKRFIVGTREEFRRYNKTGRKVVKNLSKSHLFDFHYKNAIIYETK